MNLLFPLFLIATIFIIIPIILHYYYKFKQKKIIFPAIFLFKDEIKILQKKIKWNKNITTLLRSFIILIIAILLSKPMFPEDYQFWKLEQSTKKIIVIILDNSLSMNYLEENKNRFQKAKQIINNIVKRIPLNQNILYQPISSQFVTPLTYSTNKDELLRTIQYTQVKKIDTPVNIILNNLINEINKQKIFIKEMIIISDFQKSDWKDISISSSVNISLFPVGDRESTNIAIEKISVSEDIHYANTGVDISVTIKNYSETPVNNQISLKFNDQLKEIKEISLDPHESKIVTFKKQKEYLDEIIQGKVIILSDRFNEDNVGQFNVFFKKKVNILFLENNTTPLENYAIKESILSSNKILIPNILFKSKLDDISTYDMIITNRLGSLSYDEIKIIKTHIKKNIALLLVFNKSDTVYKINQSLLNMGLSNQFKLINQINLNKDDNIFINKDLNSNHDFIKTFEKLQSPNSSFKRGFQLETKSFFLQPLLKLNKYDFLIMSEKPKENLFIVTASIDHENTNFLFDPLFPLLMNWIYNKGITKYMISSSSQSNQVKITPNLDESDIKSWTDNELKNIFPNPKIIYKPNEWLQQVIKTPHKTMIQKNTLFEQILFILLIIILFIEYLFSYQPDFLQNILSFIKTRIKRTN